MTDADELDAILTRLRRMEIDIIEASEVDRYKDGKKDTEEEEEEKPETEARYPRRPGPDVSQADGPGPAADARAGSGDFQAHRGSRDRWCSGYINRFGFIASAHLDLAQKLTEGGERFDRVILDKKIESRERYMKLLPRLCKQVEKLSAAIWRSSTPDLAQLGANATRKKLKAFQKAVATLQKLYPKFYFKQKVTEEFVHLADEHYACSDAAAGRR